MTIQEAIKSGKRFKRFGFENWLTPNSEGFSIARYSLTVKDLLATDWEVEEEKKFEVTFNQVSQMVDDFMVHYLENKQTTFVEPFIEKLQRGCYR